MQASLPLPPRHTTREDRSGHSQPNAKLTLSFEEDLRLRWAGVAYLGIILAGINSDMMFRPMALSASDTSAQALALRVSLILDSLMLMADVILALLLFSVFRAVNSGLAGAAMVFRLIQAVVIGASLMLQLVALQLPDMVAPLLAAQGDGYDLGLLFFAVNTGLMAHLLCHSGRAPKALPMLLMASAAVYLTGSLATLLAPGLAEAIQPAYAIPLLAELWFCLWLLFGHRSQSA
ncbi:DUF4386 domain-containing protein [Celeribacter neptunius]|uniref:DUF4386 domain-containing protein n=1 Tax=Celeribacter neptunius TaxID=588602 RepID=A0A1I3IQZ6_9RHOB|nr:DUF4386 domain-containing protein [Celeribacter neptunius]SFI50396.1 protein of unknown function [Celeribacter neptunius]